MTDQESKRRDEFPTESLSVALEALRRPFAADAIRFKIQNQDDSQNPSWAQVVTYIDARLVSERLNHVVGGDWSAQIEALDAAIAAPDRQSVRAVCKLTVLGVTRMDVGEGRDPKAAFSDALKRAAVHFGVGRSLYAMKPVFLSADGEGEDQLTRTRAGKLRIPPRAETWLRGKYEAWLSQRASAFGEPLDHGDEPVGESEAPAEASAPVQEATEAGKDGETKIAPSHLRVVGEQAPAPAPATREQRDALAALIEASPYGSKTVRAMAALVCDETAVDRLGEEQVEALRQVLEAADAAKVTDRRLTNAIGRAGEFANPVEGRTELYEWLLREAKKQGGPGEEKSAEAA